MADESLKRKGSLESPQILAKVPKLENDQVTEGKLDENIENKINDVFIDKIDKIMKKVDGYRSSNQESTLNVNSKLDKLLNVLDEKPERPKKRTFMSFYGNVMEWSWEGHFDMENFMRNYGVTGVNVTSHIFSYLDFKSMVAARMVSKTWYTFIENQRGIWINLMRKCFEDIPKKAHQMSVRRADGVSESKLLTVGNDKNAARCLQEWQSFGEDIIERNGKVADMITLISTLGLKSGYSFMKNSRDLSDHYLNYFRSPIEAIINMRFGYHKEEDKNIVQNLNFLKMMAKYGYLDRAMKQEKFFIESLLNWSLWELEALKFVVPFLKDKFQIQFTDYAQSPIWEAMRQKEKGLEKMQILIPLAAKKFWNSARKGHSSRYYRDKRDSDDHTPLADAIMIGNVEIVKAIMPNTKLTANPKGRRWGSYLHAAVKFGQLEILKLLIEHFQAKNFDWQQLKEKEGRSTYDLLKDEDFQVEVFWEHGGTTGTRKAKEDVGKKSKQDMLEFIESKM